MRKFRYVFNSFARYLRIIIFSQRSISKAVEHFKLSLGHIIFEIFPIEAPQILPCFFLKILEFHVTGNLETKTEVDLILSRRFKR